jgi:hypothetical protein
LLELREMSGGVDGNQLGLRNELLRPQVAL